MYPHHRLGHGERPDTRRASPLGARATEARIIELLEANNRYLARARAAEAEAARYKSVLSDIAHDRETIATHDPQAMFLTTAAWLARLQQMALVAITSSPRAVTGDGT